MSTTWNWSVPFGSGGSPCFPLPIFNKSPKLPKIAGNDGFCWPPPCVLCDFWNFGGSYLEYHVELEAPEQSEM